MYGTVNSFFTKVQYSLSLSRRLYSCHPFCRYWIGYSRKRCPQVIHAPSSVRHYHSEYDAPDVEAARFGAKLVATSLSGTGNPTRICCKNQGQAVPKSQILSIPLPSTLWVSCKALVARADACISPGQKLKHSKNRLHVQARHGCKVKS